VSPQGSADTAADAAKAVAATANNSLDAAANDAKAALLSANSTTLSLLFGVALILTLLFYFIMPAMLTIASPSQRVLYCATFVDWVLGIEANRLSALL